jgi:hypothetical protein
MPDEATNSKNIQLLLQGLRLLRTYAFEEFYRGIKKILRHGLGFELEIFKK